MPTIDDIAPDKATYHPGEIAQVRVTVTNGGEAGFRGRLSLTLRRINETVETAEQMVDLGANSTTTLLFSFTPPPTPTPMCGYGLDARLYSGKQEGSGEGNRVLAEGSGALDVLERWSQAPRYGFLSDFGPEQTEGTVVARCESLCRYHLNVVQFYDWMWRHYKLLPPPEVGEVFTDVLDRRLSMRTVRQAIREVQARGGAAMAYGAVYGAEPEFADGHPELRLYDEAGKPISLAELFFIMNIAPSSPWVPLIVAEFAEAVRELGFDGIHLDQYGFPKIALDLAGEVVDLATCFPVLIDRARAAVIAEKAEAGVIFNAVTNWPIETVAPTSQDAVYIEVWPPYESYNDLRELIREGKHLSGGKQVILAAYLSPFLDAKEEDLPQAEAAALLATAAIAASGGFHLLLGERDGLLCDPYYPKYATLRPAFAEKMRGYYDFLVRYEELLTDPALQDWPDSGAEGGQVGVRVQAAESRGDLAVRSQAEGGTVWTIVRRKPGYWIVHLLNLVGQDNIAWNALRTPPEIIRDIDIILSLDNLPPVREVLVASPDADMGRPVPVEWSQSGEQLHIHVPQLCVWSTIICVL